MITSRTSLLTLLMTAMLISTSTLSTAQDTLDTGSAPKAPSEKTTLHSRLLGAWLLAGKPGTTDEPEPGARMRFFGHGHWLITQADPETGAVIFHHGGTYTLDGNTLTEKTTFATEPTANAIGMENKFKVSVDDGTYTQIGIGNPWSESWRRAK